LILDFGFWILDFGLKFRSHPLIYAFPPKFSTLDLTATCVTRGFRGSGFRDWLRSKIQNPKSLTVKKCFLVFHKQGGEGSD
jgi:hypothetical protein